MILLTESQRWIVRLRSYRPVQVIQLSFQLILLLARYYAFLAHCLSHSILARIAYILSVTVTRQEPRHSNTPLPLDLSNRCIIPLPSFELTFTFNSVCRRAPP